MKNEIVIYRPNEIAEHIEVRFDEDTVWLNRQQIAVLFGRDVKTIGKHINNVFSEGELEREVAVAKFATTTAVFFIYLTGSLTAPQDLSGSLRIPRNTHPCSYVLQDETAYGPDCRV